MPIRCWLPIVLAAMGLSACNDGYGNYYPNVPSANIQVVHASPDAPDIAVLIDDQVLVQDLYYGEGTGELPVVAGTHTITIQAINPSGATTLVGPTTMNFQQNIDYVIELEGPVAGVSSQLYSHPLSVVASTATRVQVVHAAPSAPSVSVYVTAPGAALSAGAAFGTVAFTQALGPTDLPAGQYEIRIAPAGQVAPVLYDSGTLTLTGGDDLVISVLQNTGPGTSPVTLGVVDANGDNFRLYDVAAPAEVRVVHDSPNAPAISVIANGNTAAPLVPTLSYAAFTAYTAVTPGTYTLGITPAGNPSDVLLSQGVNLNAGDYRTVYAIGTLSALNTLVTRDYPRRVATEAKLRIVEGSSSAGSVDVYLTAHGAGIASASPLFPAIPFAGDTGFQGVAAGTYDLTITAAGTQTVVVGPTQITLANSGIYTAVPRDAAGGGAPYGLIMLDDFAP